MMKNLSRKKQSELFKEISNIPLANLTEQDYTRIIENVYLQEDNVDFFSDLIQVLKFQEKPRGIQVCQASQSGTINSSTKVTLLTIPAKKTFDIQSVVMFGCSADCQIDYWISGISDGLDYLVKTVDFSSGDRGISVDFSTMGDFLISGTQTDAVFLKASRNSGSGVVSSHNVFYREVN